MVGAHTDQRRLVGAPALGTIKIQSSLNSVGLICEIQYF